MRQISFWKKISYMWSQYIDFSSIQIEGYQHIQYPYNNKEKKYSILITEENIDAINDLALNYNSSNKWELQFYDKSNKTFTNSFFFHIYSNGFNCGYKHITSIIEKHYPNIDDINLIVTYEIDKLNISVNYPTCETRKLKVHKEFLLKLGWFEGMTVKKKEYMRLFKPIKGNYASIKSNINNITVNNIMVNYYIGHCPYYRDLQTKDNINSETTKTTRTRLCLPQINSLTDNQSKIKNIITSKKSNECIPHPPKRGRKKGERNLSKLILSKDRERIIEEIGYWIKSKYNNNLALAELYINLLECNLLNNNNKLAFWEGLIQRFKYLKGIIVSYKYFSDACNLFREEEKKVNEGEPQVNKFMDFLLKKKKNLIHS